jgi:peroxiredoxin Q/BCP
VKNEPDSTQGVTFMARIHSLVGTAFPEFILDSSFGQKISFGDLKGKWSVLFFYPKDDSPGCTVQSCRFRDDFSGYEKLGVQLFGVSSNGVGSHRRFAEKHGLPFPLLADVKGHLRTELKIPMSLGFLPGRATFIVDGEGIIRMAYNSQFRFKHHSKVALDFLRDNIDITAAQPTEPKTTQPFK